MYQLMLIGFLVLQLLLLLLDAWELRRSRSASEQPPVRFKTLLFLFGVTGVFLCIQILGGWLTPQPLEIFQSVQQLASYWGRENQSASLSVFQTGLLGLMLFYVAGLWDYLVHRLFSHSHWFWMTHEYHHLPRQVSVLMPGILARPFGFLPVALSTLATGITVYAVLLVLGLPLWDLRPLLPTLLAVGLVLTASHSIFLRRRLWVHSVLRCAFLTTPQEHLMHHGIDSHGNYGNFTTLWDRVFGTYINPANVDLEEIRLGLAYDQDFLGTITLGKLRLPRALRQKYQLSRYCNLKELPETP